MQNQNRGIFAMIENYIDMVLNVAAIYIAYFFTCLFRYPPIFPTEPITVIWILVIVIVGSFIYQAFNVYKMSVFAKSYHTLMRMFEANLTFFGFLAVIFAVLGPTGTKSFLIIWCTITFAVSCAFLAFKRKLILSIMKMLYKKQFILRKIIIIGDNTASAKDYVRQIEENPDYGGMVIGYVGDKISPEVGCDKLGSFSELEQILDKYKPTDAVFAIDAYDKRRLIRLVNLCDDKCVKVYFLPVIYGFFKSHKQLEQVGNIPIINIHSTPLDNRANAFIKRVIDIIGSAILIILTSPIMLVAAIGTRLSSPGPILFKQTRVGKLGKRFTMYKFRSMRVNDSSDSAWTTGTDSRKTRFGSFIRRTAIDELPQLFNVLFGSMSLVGPRPEIPKFVEEFKEVIPLYMVKHYVKPGMTGLAQVKGLRGDTSVEDRIHEDIAYIENWSLAMDIAILFKTPFKAFNKSEQYIETEIKEHPELYGDAPDGDMVEIIEALDTENSHEHTIDVSVTGDDTVQERYDKKYSEEESTEAELPLKDTEDAKNGDKPLGGGEENE